MLVISVAFVSGDFIGTGRDSQQNLKPDCGETRSGEWQKLMHFLN
jgi:hypothetical protein